MAIIMSEELLRAHVRMILIQIWDPIGVKRFGIDPEVAELAGEPDDGDNDLIVRPLQPLTHKIVLQDMEDEYDIYLPQMLWMIFEKKTAKDFFNALRTLEDDNLGRRCADGVTRNAANRLAFVAQECGDDAPSLD